MPSAKGGSRATYTCSFCGKNQDQVRRLIAGPGAVYICDECVELCREIIRLILVKHTGQDEERIRRDFDRDFFMNPEQAKAYGIIDEILTKPEGQ